MYFSNNAKSPRKNDDFTGDGLFYRKRRHGPIDIINGSTNHTQESIQVTQMINS